MPATGAQAPCTGGAADCAAAAADATTAEGVTTAEGGCELGSLHGRHDGRLLSRRRGGGGRNDRGRDLGDRDRDSRGLRLLQRCAAEVQPDAHREEHEDADRREEEDDVRGAQRVGQVSFGVEQRGEEERRRGQQCDDPDRLVGAAQYLAVALAKAEQLGEQILGGDGEDDRAAVPRDRPPASRPGPAGRCAARGRWRSSPARRRRRRRRSSRDRPWPGGGRCAPRPCLRRRGRRRVCRS